MNIKQYLASGILERYVIGDVSENERTEVDAMIEKHAEIKHEILELQHAFEAYAWVHAVKPPPALKAKLLAKAEAESRLSLWIEKADQIPAPDDSAYDHLYSKTLEKNEVNSVMLVWAKKGLPEELHTDILETFWVLEGSCDCFIGGEKTSMTVGDKMEIPLHIKHSVIVTSSHPLKVIFQQYKLSA